MSSSQSKEIRKDREIEEDSSGSGDNKYILNDKLNVFLEGFNKAHVTSHLVSRAPIAHGKYSMGLFFKQNRLCEAHIMCYKHSTPCEVSNVFSKYSIQSL